MLDKFKSFNKLSCDISRFRRPGLVECLFVLTTWKFGKVANQKAAEIEVGVSWVLSLSQDI